MRIDVRLFSHFRSLMPSEARGRAEVELPDGATVAHLLDRLGIAAQARLVTVNNMPEPDRARVLHDGDTVRIFPPVVGGE